jgi:tRNA uridine 5-carboxymethylaminomethyl modification enzyme
MFTSRAEFRLHLRSDNADQRLTATGVSLGLVGSQRAEIFAEKAAALTSGRVLLDGLRTTPSAARKAGIAVNADGIERSAFELLSYPSVTADDATRLWPQMAVIAPPILEQLVIDAQYAVYVDRQYADVEAVRRDEGRDIPKWVDFDRLPGLSMEVRQKLTQFRPATIAQAQAIDGVTPAAITLLLSVIRRGTLTKAG